MFLKRLSDEQILSMAVTLSPELFAFWSECNVGYLELIPMDKYGRADLLCIEGVYFGRIETVQLAPRIDENTYCSVVGYDGVGVHNHPYSYFKSLGSKRVEVNYGQKHYDMYLRVVDDVL